MRRTMGIVVGAVTALALTGVAGITAYVQRGDEGRVVGTWHEAPQVAPTPVALQRTAQPPTAQPGGRERVGTLTTVGKLIGYDAAPHHATFRYPAASYVKLHFSRMVLLPGDYVTVSDAAGGETRRYDAPPDTSKPAGRWAMSVTGDTAVLRLHRSAPVPPGTDPDSLGVTVDRAAHGYTPGERAAAPPLQPLRPAAFRPAAFRPAGFRPAGLGGSVREESVCGGDESADAVCYRSADPVAYTRSRAIARLLINGTELCTGWRIGLKNRMLTNNHCFDDSADARDTEIWFNYQCATCGGGAVSKATKVWGDRVLATNRGHDYTLFTVGQFSLIRKFGNLSLDTRRPSRAQELYIPQHPAGKPTRISGARGERAGTCAVVDNGYDGYLKNSDVSYYCDTQGGSSGSPVLSRYTDKVVALHHFGGCPNSGVRADLIYHKIKALI